MLTCLLNFVYFLTYTCAAELRHNYKAVLKQVVIDCDVLCS